MSFLSVEPQSRVVLENFSNSLLAEFDSQLRIIADRYLAFFQERRDIEETYVNSLRRLHQKAKTVDASFDPRTEPRTAREAWEKARDHLEKGMRLNILNFGPDPTVVAEANAQQAFVDILSIDIIKPLATFKTTRKKTTDKTRKRIEEELKIFATACADHVENRIPELQAAYFKKYYPQFRGQQGGSEEPERAKSKDVSDDDFRLAVCLLNAYRSIRAEDLQDGYDCLEEIVFAPIAKTVIVQYMDGMITTSAKYDSLAISTRVEVEKVLARKDTSESDLRASFRRTLSFSIPPPTFYRNYCPGVHSDLIFGAPLVDLVTNQDNVSKVMRMCIEEVEKRGLDTWRIYLDIDSVRKYFRPLRQRLESDRPFSFRSTDDIHSVATLLLQYLLDLPEPLFVLSLQDYRNYKQIRAKYPENDFSLLRTKIRELHPVHRASLGALLRHLLCVASYSDMNAITVEDLAARFRDSVLRGNDVLQDGVRIKGLVLEDLIRNVHTLFDDQHSTTPPVPSPAAETTSIFPSGSFLGAELSQLSEADVMGPNTRRLGPIGVTPSLTQPSFSSLPLDVDFESSLTPPPTTLPGPLLGLPSSNSLVEGTDTNLLAQATPGVRGMASVEPGAFVDRPPPEVVSVSRTSVTEWQLRQSQLPSSSQPEAVTTPQSPTESVLSCTSDLPLSSIMSL
ncbi:hypothetical protein V8E53_002183 [Lactarius tabidus]